VTDEKRTSSDQPEATTTGQGKAADGGTPPKPPEPADDLVTTHHTLHTSDGDLTYSATTGRIVLRQEATKEEKYDGRKAKAEVSITYYTLDEADVTQRPVTFAFNGGPGSSSVWLHLGVLGRRTD